MFLGASMDMGRAQGLRFFTSVDIAHVGVALFRVRQWILHVHTDAFFGCLLILRLHRDDFIASVPGVSRVQGRRLLVGSMDIVRAKGRLFRVRPWTFRVHRDRVFVCVPGY
jgi:hypothetical protein